MGLIRTPGVCKVCGKHQIYIRFGSYGGFWVCPDKSHRPKNLMDLDPCKICEETIF